MAQGKRTTRKKKTTKKKIAKKGEPGIRIYELSRELKAPKAAVLEVAEGQRIPATSQFSTVTEEQAQAIRDAFGNVSATPKSESKKQASKKQASKKQASKKASKRSSVKATATATTTTKTTGGKKKASTRVLVTQDVGRGKGGNPRLKTLCMQFLEGCGC